MDLFETWLYKETESQWVQRALRDSSYNNFRSNGVKKDDLKYEESHTPLPVNTDLALLGDSIIKFIYS